MLRAEHLMEAAFMDTLMLLATLCSDDEILVDISSANLAGAKEQLSLRRLFSRVLFASFAHALVKE